MVAFYTKHAEQRMAQRNITKSDIQSVIYNGVINRSKSTEKSRYLEYQGLKVIATIDNVVITAFRDEAHNLKNEIQALTLEADQFAKEFKLYFEAASLRFSEGYKADAKSLSLTGHALKDACMSLNSHIKTLRQVSYY